MYHVNPSTGEASKCRAELACPFGGLEEHSPTIEQARQRYEAQASKLVSQFSLAQEKLEALDKTYCSNIHRRRNVVKAVEKAADKTEALAKLKAIDSEQKALTDKIRQAYYAREIAAKRLSENSLLEAVPAFSKQTEGASMSNRMYLAKTSMRVSFSPLKEKDRAFLVEEYSAWAGKSKAQAEAVIEATETAEDRDAAVVALFQQSWDTSRERVYIDLETTGFHPTMSEIIEIGIVRVSGDGKIIEELKERFDLQDPAVRDELGVGPTEVHKISPSDVAGLPPFTSPEVQQRLGKILNNSNSIVIAHNKNFENSFLSHYLEGYAEARLTTTAEAMSGQEPAPMIDTKNISSFLLHSTPNNKLESFALANGVAYENAHTAIDDARMTHRALENFRKELSSSQPGVRPNLSWPEMETK